MEGARFQGSNAQYQEYKKLCPPEWIVSTQFHQDGRGDVTISDAGGSASSLEPSSSDTLIAPSPVSSSSTVQETANAIAQAVTPTREISGYRTKSTGRVPKSSSPSSKSSLRSKLNGFFHTRSGSKSKRLSGQSTYDSSFKPATQDMGVKGNDDTPEPSEATINQFRWPIATSPAVDAGIASAEHPEPPTAGLKFQPKQFPPQPPKTCAAPAATSSQPPPPKAPSTHPAVAPSKQGPPPAPSASANNPTSMYNAMGQSYSAVSRSSNPMSSGLYSASTASDLADVPSRLPYQSPGYSPGYSYH